MRSVVISLMVFAFLFFSCSQEKQKEEEEKEAVAFVPQKITDTTSFANAVTSFDDRVGFIGIYEVPEMLVLSIIDSAQTKEVSSKLVKNYAILEEEMNAIGAEMNGAIGQITYNNNPNNFIFESVLCIKRLPAKQPKRCKIVVLEATRMLIYNFYGSYRNLFAAYDKLKEYREKNNLIQSGPLREFYITDPGTEKDPNKWLTRVMLPVASKIKK